MPPDPPSESSLNCVNAPNVGAFPDRMPTGSGQRAAGSGQRAAGSGQRAAGSGQRAAVLFAARSATALNRLLDVLPVFEGDERITRRFTLVPGSEFDVDALAAVDRAGARTVPWDEACRRPWDLVVAASPKGELRMLSGPRVLLPHGAGFGKTVPGEGAARTASGLDPEFLLPDGEALTSVHALAHPRQVDRLRATSPAAAARAAVVGDPTLERILESRGRRERYRAALGTGTRRLVVLTSTWGPECLLRRRPALFGDLALRLPVDTYQLAFVIHPNEREHLGEFDLAEQLAPAVVSGVVLTRPCEDWAATLVAADTVITDHGSTALYAAAVGCPVIAAHHGGEELIPDSPISQLLSRSPFLDRPEDFEAALAAAGPLAARAAAADAFSGHGHVLSRLRGEMYALLGLSPRAHPVTARPLPSPEPPAYAPAAFAVRTHTSGTQIRVERYPTRTEHPVHHLAAEHGRAGERHAQSAALLYRHARPASGHGDGVQGGQRVQSVSGWAARTLDAYPGCHTAAVILYEVRDRSPRRCLLRTRDGPLVSVRIEPCRGTDGGLVVPDPAVVLSAIHAWLSAGGAVPATVSCVIADRPFQARLALATTAEAEQAS